MGLKKILGTLAPGWILRRIRRVRALKIQRNVIRMQGGVTNCVPEFYCYRIKALKRIPADKKIIWQYWADGFDSPNIPELVKVCLRSVEKHTPQYLLFRLSDENLNEWIEMPCWLYKKRPLCQKLILRIFSGVCFCLCTEDCGLTHRYFLPVKFPNIYLRKISSCTEGMIQRKTGYIGKVPLPTISVGHHNLP